MNFTNELKAFLRNFDFSNVDAEALILEGNADEQIISFARNAGVLYVGSNDKSALRRAFMGSVSEKVIREVETSIVLVKNEDLFKLKIPEGSVNVEKHYDRGTELLKLGFLKESATQYKAALKQNELHLSSIKALAKVYELKGKIQQSNYYTELQEAITNGMQNRKIEQEIRRAYRTTGS